MSMNNRIRFAGIIMAALATLTLAMTSGCATKRYGRMQELSGVERTHYTCREIELELAKVTEFRRQIAEGAEINLASVGGFLGDFGIGNAMEKGAAERTAAQRETDLLDLKASKRCVSSPASPNG